jgi:hypothetical protein
MERFLDHGRFFSLVTDTRLSIKKLQPAEITSNVWVYVMRIWAIKDTNHE